MRQKSCTIALALTFVFALACGSAVFANEHAPKSEPVKLHPSKAYSGSSPIDLSNGLLGDNGTFGLPNAEYESWSMEPMQAVNLSSKPYPFDAKPRFIIAIEDRLAFYDAALFNWDNTSKSSIAQKPEAMEYAKQATEAIKPALEKARAALNDAKKAGSGDWTKAEADARNSFLALQGTYQSLHKNVR